MTKMGLKSRKNGSFWWLPQECELMVVREVVGVFYITQPASVNNLRVNDAASSHLEIAWFDPGKNIELIIF